MGAICAFIGSCLFQTRDHGTHQILAMHDAAHHDTGNVYRHHSQHGKRQTLVQFFQHVADWLHPVWPLVAAVGLPVMATGAISKTLVIVLLGVAILIVGVFRWAFEPFEA